MSNKTKHKGGPITNEGKAISSRNSTTHGLTARRGIDSNEQSLFDETVEAFNSDFNPQTSIEKILISKLAECTVRLMRVQQVENAMFDLARSEAGYPEDSINSLSNNNEDLTQAVQNTSPLKLQFNADDFTEKMDILDEIKQQDFDDISDWNYLESTMPNVSDCIIQKCTDENISLYDFISQEVECSNKNLVKVVIVGVEDADEEIKETKPV